MLKTFGRVEGHPERKELRKQRVQSKCILSGMERSGVQSKDATLFYRRTDMQHHHLTPLKSRPRHLPRRSLVMAAVWLPIATLTLNGCLNAGPTPTPTPTLSTPTPTPTFIFPTMFLTATFTPEPVPTATLNPQTGFGAVLYQDDFNRNLGWEVGQSELGGSSLVNGRLSLAVRQSNAFYFLRSPAPATSDFFLKVSVRSELCSGRDEFGVMYRVNSLSEHYRFALTCDGAARVSRVLERGEIALVPITQTYAIFPGILVDNRISVWASGKNFRFYINDMEVFSARDSALQTGGFALFVRSRRGGQTTVSFNDLTVHSLLPTPTLTSTVKPSTSP